MSHTSPRLSEDVARPQVSRLSHLKPQLRQIEADRCFGRHVLEQSCAIMQWLHHKTSCVF